MSEDSPIRLRISIRQVYYSVKPMLLSHHPSCEEYKNHTITLFGKKWCIGCFVGMPIVVLVFLIGVFGKIMNKYSNFQLWMVGIIIFTVSYAMKGYKYVKPLKKLNERAVKIIAKIFLGIGVGIMLGTVYIHTPESDFKLLIFYLIFQGIFIITEILHLFGMYSECKQCEYKADWDNCPGMKASMEIFHSYEKNLDEKIE
jgi:cation transport ATPase